MEYCILLFLVLFLIFWLYMTERKYMLNKMIKKKKGEKRTMPTEMLKEFIGRDCTISLFNDLGSGVQGKILSVEENWIKVEEKKKLRIINGDMIRDIAIIK